VTAGIPSLQTDGTLNQMRENIIQKDSSIINVQSFKGASEVEGSLSTIDKIDPSALQI